MLLPDPLPAHPRLLVRPGDWERIRAKIAADVPSRRIWDTLVDRANAICDLPPLQRTMTGRMLLMVSREALERISVLAMVDSVGGDGRYGGRVVEELLAVCRFADWNPGHFLDTAEMCLAVSIGFDWLHDLLSPGQRDEVAGAILRLAIAPSLDTSAATNWWLTTDENWAQVCHGGLAAGAIAIADREPELAEAILARALAAIPRVAASYAPDGAYPEGPMYWSYGTGYHVVLAAALESLTGSTQSVDAYPGFAESAGYINAMTAPSGEYFNYADCAAQRRLQVQLFWMASRYRHPEWPAHDLATLEAYLAEYRRDPGAQYWYYDMVALALLWRQPESIEQAEPPAFWAGAGEMPVAVYRWGESNCFLGVKGGEVGLSHSHMDVGSFVFEAAGVRWAVDPGMQDYAGLEAAGVDLWNERQQYSQRWEVFRIGPESHNILRFDDLPQLLFRHVPLTAEASKCSVDLSELYGAGITARREFECHTDGFSVADSWIASGAVAARSQWLTFAKVSREEDRVVLSQDDRRVCIEWRASHPLDILVENVDQPVRSFDAPNPALKRISFVSPKTSTGSMRIRAYPLAT